jgi:hypothetical protein
VTYSNSEILNWATQFLISFFGGNLFQTVVGAAGMDELKAGLDIIS